MAEYIEREALWRAFEYEPFYDNADRDEIVLPKIDDFPTADVVEVKHGRWIDKVNPDRFEFKLNCSNCQCGSDLKTDYCPNCGARMDGE